jgi:hypothetical protein
VKIKIKKTNPKKANRHNTTKQDAAPKAVAKPPIAIDGPSLKQLLTDAYARLAANPQEHIVTVFIRTSDPTSAAILDVTRSEHGLPKHALRYVPLADLEAAGQTFS